MATSQQHVKKAQHNEGLLAPLRVVGTHPDWYITTCFYAGVQWIRAYLALNKIGAGQREQIGYEGFSGHLLEVGKNTSVPTPDIAAANRDFKRLKDLGRDARYYCYETQWYAERMDDAEGALRAVREYVLAHGVTLPTE